MSSFVPQMSANSTVLYHLHNIDMFLHADESQEKEQKNKKDKITQR